MTQPPPLKYAGAFKKGIYGQMFDNGPIWLERSGNTLAPIDSVVSPSARPGHPFCLSLLADAEGIVA
jgi:hypothetical protein